MDRLVGKKIYLDQLLPNDFSENYLVWMNDDEVSKYLESRFSNYTELELNEYVKNMYISSNDYLMGIYDLKTNRHIGNIKLGNINWIHKYGDIGLLIGEKDFWGKGIATEAIELLTEYGFSQLKLHKIWAGIYETNVGSIKAFEKAGFKLDGIRKSHFYIEGQYIDAIQVAKFADS